MAAAATASSLFNESIDKAAPTISSSLPSVSDCSRGGFRGMFKVPSLVFDIELEDNGIGGHWQEEDWEEDEVVTEIQRFVQPATQAEARLLSDVRVACQHAKDGQDTSRLVSILSALGYKCSLRTALGGGDGADCLRNLRHTFITCETPATNTTPARRYVIDPQFKEQFIIAKTTSRYAAILAAVPQVFVGPEEHLSLLVNFLCTEMGAAFRQLGSVLPPWRHASSMLSKWRPRRSIDEGAATAAGVAAGLMAGVPAAGVIVAGAGVGGMGTPSTGMARGFGTGPNGLQSQWPCMPAAAAGQGNTGVNSPDHQGFPWQQQLHQQAQQQQLGGGIGAGAGAGGMGMMIAGAAGRRPSYEPLRVVFGGNFASVTPSPALAS